jgi:hypothetical protein
MKGIGNLENRGLGGNHIIKLYLKEIGQEIVDFFHLAQNMAVGGRLLLKR